MASLNGTLTSSTRRFYMMRHSDVSGVSGTGKVLEGVQLPSGKIVVEWRPPLVSVCLYNSIADFEAIHSHEGKANIVWLDDKEE